MRRASPSELPAKRKLSDFTTDQLVSMRVDLGRKSQLHRRAMMALNGRIARISNEIRQRNAGAKTRLEVTDHAVLRYLERAKGVNVNALREEIMNLVDGGETVEEFDRFVTRAGGLAFVRDARSGAARDPIVTVFTEDMLDDIPDEIEEEPE